MLRAFCGSRTETQALQALFGLVLVAGGRIKKVPFLAKDCCSSGNGTRDAIDTADTDAVRRQLDPCQVMQGSLLRGPS